VPRKEQWSVLASRAVGSFPSSAAEAGQWVVEHEAALRKALVMLSNKPQEGFP